jgi:hypothetical protein
MPGVKVWIKMGRHTVGLIHMQIKFNALEVRSQYNYKFLNHLNHCVLSGLYVSKYMTLFLLLGPQTSKFCVQQIPTPTRNLSFKLQKLMSIKLLPYMLWMVQVVQVIQIMGPGLLLSTSRSCSGKVCSQVTPGEVLDLG